MGRNANKWGTMGFSISTVLLHISKPRVVLVIAMLIVFCWGTRNGTHASVNHQKNVRLRVPLGYPGQHQNQGHNSQLQLFQPTEDRTLIERGGVIGGSDEMGAVGPFVGNIVEESFLPETRKKRDCGRTPSIAQRGLVGPSLKRSYFAFTQDEVDEKLKEQDYPEKREVKRNEVAQTTLPWTCETKYEWMDMGVDHYPRFVRTAECKNRSCFNGFFRCRPRRYKTKVLKRVSSADSTSCEEDDVSLPESLRPTWRFRTVEINLCCDCGGRVPGLVENVD